MNYSKVFACVLGLAMLAAAIQISCSSMPITVNGKQTTVGEAFGSGDSAAGGTQTIAAGETVTIGGADTKPVYRLATEVSGTIKAAKDGAGWVDCGYRAVALTTPIAKLDVTETTDMIVEVYGESEYNHGFVLVAPGNKHICKHMGGNHSRIRMEFEPGEYAVYPAWSPKGGDDQGVQTTKQLTLAVSTKERTDEAPRYKFDADTPNPWRTEPAAYTGSVNTTKAWDWKCSRTMWMSSAPVATFEIAEEAEKTVAIEATESDPGMLVVRDSDGTGWCLGSSETRKWEPGSYSVHALWGKSHDEHRPPTIEEQDKFGLLVYREGAPASLPKDIPRHEIGKLPSPKIFKGTTRADKDRRAKYKCDEKSIRYSTQPDFFIETERPLADLTLRLIDFKRDIVMMVEKSSNGSLDYRHRPDCTRGTMRNQGIVRKRTIGTADGEYAVYLGDEGESRDYILLVTEKDTEVDPLMRVEEVPEGLPLEKRSFGRWHPLHSDVRTSLELQLRMWREVPTQLLVYPTRDLDDASAKQSNYGAKVDFQPMKGEPLLVRSVSTDRDGNPKEVSVLTTDLARFTILASQLTTDKPAKLNAATKPRFEMNMSYGHLLTFATTAEKKRVDKVAKMKKRADDCYRDYWEKNHGSTPSGVDLYEVQYDSKGNVKRVQNYSDKVHKRALRACPVDRAQKAHDRLKADMAKTFEKQRAKLMSEVAKRLE